MVGYSRAYAEAFAHVEAPKRKRGRPRKHPVKTKPEKTFPDCRADFGFPRVMQDITPFISPIDGTEISSRSKLKAHEQRHGVRQCGDFRKGEIIAKENKRIEDSLRGAEMETVKWE